VGFGVTAMGDNSMRKEDNLVLFGNKASPLLTGFNHLGFFSFLLFLFDILYFLLYSPVESIKILLRKTSLLLRVLISLL
jgi:hypothetical protein